ncbi:4a-hydroxytetrahydrobiopterin dehydratase [Legionella londiniensis]|uniref:Putative pterin-4-alpha-carbinolamine dehydratase n=1 Tax=Legionella londiniensis TaxID=45068 RepID=A0A0W0VPJ1_9GAMM|nr:4a-hydroxytetrahydrobiopterin dehydratase [Legionella londiniensis]KTD21837.1 pterin 4 alpha carbinolamine dehydratase [Legionella londiniensis]STX92680.1 Pterin-4a-carbinolamine dehydratase [Legionella londiniensis]
MKSDLSSKHCEACEGIGEALNASQIQNLLPQLKEGWQVSDDQKAIKKSFSFKNFYETMAFVNAIAWIANAENHHPDLQLGYNYCKVLYTTHALNGLTQNDFICAAKIDKLLEA